MADKDVGGCEVAAEDDKGNTRKKVNETDGFTGTKRDFTETVVFVGGCGEPDGWKEFVGRGDYGLRKVEVGRQGVG